MPDIASKFGDPRYAGWHYGDIFGTPDQLTADGNDLFALLAKAAARPDVPPVIHICGTEDYLWQDNVKMKEAFESIKWPGYIFESHPGAHGWDFWDKHIQTILKFFFCQ